MTAATPAQRKAAERAAKRKQGLAPIEVWSYPECFPAIRQHAAKLTAKTAKARKAAKQAQPTPPRIPRAPG